MRLVVVLLGGLGVLGRLVLARAVWGRSILGRAIALVLGGLLVFRLWLGRFRRAGRLGAVERVALEGVGLVGVKGQMGRLAGRGGGLGGLLLGRGLLGLLWRGLGLLGDFLVRDTLVLKIIHTKFSFSQVGVVNPLKIRRWHLC